MTKRRSPGDGSLSKRKSDGLWVGSVEIPSLDGKRRQRRVFSKNRNEAIRKLKALKADVDAGRVAYTSRTTVEAWLQRWIEDIRGPKLRPGTKDDYARTIRLHINPHIGTKRLDRLTAQDVRVMQTSIKASRTAQLAHVILRSALGDAIKEGMLSRNVAEVADKPKHATTQRTPLSSPEAKQLLRSAIDSRDPFATRWAAALLLGARQGEILGLQWSRLDLDNGIADFRWQLQQLEQAHGCGDRHSDGTYPCGKVRVGYCPQRRWDLPRGFEHQILHRSLALTAPKTRAGTRIVPIPAPLWAMLKKHQGDGCEHREVMSQDCHPPIFWCQGCHMTSYDQGRTWKLESPWLERDNPHDLVWHHDDGRPISPRDDYDNWQTALSNAGLPPAPLHIARNTCATLLAEAGVPEDIRMAILGQVSLTAHRSYVYRDQAQARQAMTALDQLLG